MIYFTADTHFDHANIIQYCKRPFKKINEMNKVLINNYNKTVGINDTCYFLGDVMFPTNKERLKRILEKLNGIKHLILGNHDNLNPFDYIECGFNSVHTSLEITIHNINWNSCNFTLVHDPSLSLIDRNKLFLGGHIHDLFIVQKNFINVGVDVHNYYPVTGEEIIKKYLRNKND